MPGGPRLAGGYGIQPGGGQMKFVATLPPGLAQSVGSVAATTTYAVLVRVFTPTLVTKMAYGVGAAAGNVDLGIYTSDGTTATKVASTGATAAAGATAAQTINLTAPYTLMPGADYYLAIWVSTGTTLTIYRGAGALPLNFVAYRVVQINSGGSALPATISLASTSAGAAPDLIALP